MTSIRDSVEIKARCAPYGIAVAQVKPFADGLCGRSFHITDRRGREFVLKELVGRSVGAAHSLLRTLDHLASQGVKAPRPLALPSGERLLESLEWPSFLAPYLPGRTLDRLEALPVEQMAVAMAAIHETRPPPHLHLRSRRIPSDWRNTLQGLDCTDLRVALEQAEAAASVLDEPDDGFRLIHGDPFPDNLLQTCSGAITALDWDEASIDNPLLDLAIAAVGIMTRCGGGIHEVARLFAAYGARRGRKVDRRKIDRLIAYATGLLAYVRFVRYNSLVSDTGRRHIYRDLLCLTAN